MPPQTIGLIAHTLKPGVGDLLAAVRREFLERSVRVLVETNSARLLGERSSLSVTDLAREVELLVVLGGDGTILNVVSQLDNNLRPIFGINVGSLGFLTCVNFSLYKEAVLAILAGEIVFTQRTMLGVDVRMAIGL